VGHVGLHKHEIDYKKHKSKDHISRANQTEMCFFNYRHFYILRVYFDQN